MEWTDEAIVIASRRHGETSSVMTVLTREHGRHAGLVRGGGGQRARGALQPGNRLQVTWRARLAEHSELSPGSLRRQTERGGWATARACRAYRRPARWSRQPCRSASPIPSIRGLAMLLDAARRGRMGERLCALGTRAADELGYGLDLSRCAATGSNDDLVYVSPRTRACRRPLAGEPYRDKLLAMPPLSRASTAPEPPRRSRPAST